MGIGRCFSHIDTLPGGAWNSQYATMRLLAQHLPVWVGFVDEQTHRKGCTLQWGFEVWRAFPVTDTTAGSLMSTIDIERPHVGGVVVAVDLTNILMGEVERRTRSDNVCERRPADTRGPQENR
eukprot:2488316-Amphidinium_carterae.1